MQMACDIAIKALSGPLLPSQQQMMLAHMDTDPHLVHAMLLKPQQLAALVEHNPMLAFHVMMRLRGSRRVDEFDQVGTGIHPHGCVVGRHGHQATARRAELSSLTAAPRTLAFAAPPIEAKPPYPSGVTGAWPDAAQPAQHGGHQQADSIRVPAP